MSQEKDSEPASPGVPPKREIKFQAWNVAGKNMVESSTSMATIVSKHIKAGRGLQNGNGPELTQDEHILMQFTSLKDKSGKDIYEGDVIVAIITEWSVPTMGEIRFSEEYQAFANYNDGGVTLLFKLNDFNILGNIYENPELLRGAPLAAGPRLAEQGNQGNTQVTGGSTPEQGGEAT